MNSVSEKRYSLEELKQLNMPPEPTPAPPPAPPTAEDWSDLMNGLEEIYRLMDAQRRLLEWLVQTQEDRPTREQMDTLKAEIVKLRTVPEQAGRKKERRYSLPRLRLPDWDLPTPSPAWLLVIPILVGLWALWYSLGELWNAIRSLLQLLL